MGLAEHNWGESEAADEVWKLVVGLDPNLAGDCLAVSLVAYIDDSRDPEGGTFVLAGHVATVENWAKLAQEWGELLPRFALLNKNNVYEFKMQEMMQTPDRIENIQPFFRLIEKYVLASISVCINRHDLRRAQSRIMVPKLAINWGDLANPYNVAYRALMDTFHSRRNEMGGGLPNEPIDFIFDEQGEAKALQAAWHGYLETRPSAMRQLYGQLPVFRSSEKYKPLQAADLWAGWIRICELAHDYDNIAKCDFGSWKGNKGAPPIIHVVWTEEELVGDLIKAVRAEIEPGRPIYDVRFNI